MGPKTDPFSISCSSLQVFEILDTILRPQSGAHFLPITIPVSDRDGSHQRGEVRRDVRCAMFRVKIEGRSNSPKFLDTMMLISP
jgi:hypothetical protein